MSYSSFAVDSVVAQKAVACIQNAVGDDIIQFSRDLKTHNSTPAAIWDFLNTNLCKAFSSPDCMTYDAKRGPWELVLLYEPKSGFLFTFMREKRFSEIRATLEKRKNMHYVDMLVHHFNADLIAPTDQLRLYPVNFNDEDHLCEKVHSLLSSFTNCEDLVKHYAIVLFDSAATSLRSVRAVMVDSNLNIVEEENWSQYIDFRESILTEQVDSRIASNNDPRQGLRLTQKAESRKKNNLVRRKVSKSNENQA